MNIQFSFIVPVYNAEEHLSRCLESILSQTYSSIEVILINDGSTDNSSTICDEIAVKDTRILVVHKNNEGPAATRNVGLEKATGDYIMFVDADDFIEIQSCEIFANIIYDFPDVEIISANKRFIKRNLTYDSCQKESDDGVVLSGSEFLKFQLKSMSLLTGVLTYIIKRDFLVKNNLFFDKDLVIGEDNLFIKKAFLLSKRVLVKNYVFYHYNCISPSITRSKDFSLRTIRAEKKMKSLQELERLYGEINDKELKALLYDDLVNEYMCTFVYGRLFNHGHVINLDFLKANIISKYNKLRVLLYGINPRLYYYAFVMFFALRENRYFDRVSKFIKKKCF